MPRYLECLISIFILILISPLLLIIILAIVIDSPGWPFFFQRRVGKNGKLFWLIKFRKMPVSVPADGKGITTSNDIRLTRMGRFMERLKFDELPQFINIIKGDLALIGPRPELEKFVKYYPEKWEKVLSIRPGVIGYSQGKIPHEADLYPADCMDHEQYYIENILPEKLDNEISYIEKKGPWFDLYVFFWVSYALITKTITPKWIIAHMLHFMVLISDTIVSCISLILGFFLVHPQFVYGAKQSNIHIALIVCVIVRPIMFMLFGLHKQHISSLITLQSFTTIIKASSYSCLAIIMVMMMFFDRDLVLRAHLIDIFLLPFLLIGIRITYIFINDHFLAKDSFQSWMRAFNHLLILLMYGLLGLLSFWLSMIIRKGELYSNLFFNHFQFSIYVLIIRAFLSYFIWPPKAQTWRTFIRVNLVQNLNMTLLGTGLIILTYQLFNFQLFSRSALLIDIILYSFIISLISLFWCLPQIKNNKTNPLKKVIFIGTNTSTEIFLNSLHRSHDHSLECIGIITEVEWNRFSAIAGTNVIGTIYDFESICEVYHPDFLIMWNQHGEREYLSYIKKICANQNIRILNSPTLETIQSII